MAEAWPERPRDEVRAPADGTSADRTEQPAVAPSGTAAVVASGPTALARREPTYAREEISALSQRLKDAYGRRKRLLDAGAATDAIDREILELKRQLREGGRLRAGDSLGEGRYVLVGELGRGGFAIVWKAKDEYGHKLCLATGASGLITDCHVEKGNPADATLAISMLERHMERYGRAPKQACFDGGFSSRANLEEIKKLDVDDVVFSKAKGITVEEMAGNETTFRSLRNFRAGIEATISFLKRCVGWTRCAWRSLRSFTAYAWASVVTANLLLIARRQPN